MGTDDMESMKRKLNQGKKFYLRRKAETKEEAEKIFKALAGCGQIELDLQKTFWGAYFGMLKDKFGIQCMVDHSYEQDN